MVISHDDKVFVGFIGKMWEEKWEMDLKLHPVITARKIIFLHLSVILFTGGVCVS